jgi:8-oxo-dGTP pyrophosphatase MutT (NUDIX family)
MLAEYCIYFGDKPFFITARMNERLYALTTWGGTLVINQPDAGCVEQAIHDLDKTNAQAAILLTNKVAQYWNQFKEKFEWIEAAGGLVENENKEWLFIFRRGFWDLPKGKLDGEETPEEAAQREVMEETGIRELSIYADLGFTFHTYHENGHFFLKQTRWYAMRCRGMQALVPQTEEGIEKITWLNQQDCDSLLPQTFPSVREVVQRCRQIS